MILAINCVSAQEIAEVIINNDGSISLPTDQELSQMYAIDITSLEFDSLEEAVDHFSEINSKYLAFRPDIENNTAYLFLQTAKRSQWSVEDWNTLLSDIKIFPKY